MSTNNGIKKIIVLREGLRNLNFEICQACFNGALYKRANFDYLISIIMLEIQSRSFEIIHSMVICN